MTKYLQGIKKFCTFERITRIIELILLTAGIVIGFVGLGKFADFINITTQSINAKDATLEQLKVVNPKGEGVKITPGQTTTLEFIGDK